jgi:hypothetical protein
LKRERILMHTIAISNQKGGIGKKKTVTISVPVATELGVYWDTLAQLLIGEKEVK